MKQEHLTLATVETSEPEASEQLGEGKLPRGNRIGWAKRQLRRGALLARHGWRCEPEPKRLWMQLEGIGTVEILSTRFAHSVELAKFSRLSWADVSGADWYVVNQLELVR
jgi:hypothetical protein